MQDFHKLRVWTEANSLAISIKRLTCGFPKADYGSLRRQRDHQRLAGHVCDVRKMTWGLHKKVLAGPQNPTRP